MGRDVWTAPYLAENTTSVKGGVFYRHVRGPVGTDVAHPVAFAFAGQDGGLRPFVPLCGCRSGGEVCQAQQTADPIGIRLPDLLAGSLQGGAGEVDLCIETLFMWAVVVLLVACALL